MTYEPRAKGRIRTAVRTTEKWIKGDGIGPSAPQPQPLILVMAAVPKDDIEAWGTGDVNEVDFSTDELFDDDIEVLNRTSSILEKDVEYYFIWIQGLWVPFFNDCGAAPPPED